MVYDLPDGALGAYSAFLAVLIEEELQGLPRGLLNTAMKKAELVSVQETVLRRAAARTQREAGRTSVAASLRTSQHNTPGFATCELLFYCLVFSVVSCF